VDRKVDEMAETFDVVVRVVSQEGTCHAGHKVGDEWVIGPRTPEGICLAAFYTMYPIALMLLTGAQLTWRPDPNIGSIACPDAANPVVFELRRVPR
jgi:uncharacterized repeat protein (TIGR04076 family)